MTQLNLSLLPWQKEVYADEARFKVVVGGRRLGKSRLSAVSLLVEGLQCPVGSCVMYVAPTLQQAKVILWDLLMDIGRDVIQSSHVNDQVITLVNGAKIYLRGSDRPDTLRGVSLTYLVLDEVADIKPDTWERILRAALADKKGKALFIGTPKGRNWFYDMYNLGLEGKDPEWKSWHFTSKDNPLIDPAEIAAAKSTLSSFAFKQEFEASFDNAGTDLFKEQWIKFGEEPDDGVWYIAIDLAGFTNVNYSAARQKRLDESAIAVVKVTDDGVWFVKKIEHGRWDVKDAAARILKNISEFKPMGVGMERGTVRNAVLPYLSDLMRSNNVYASIHDLTHGGKQKTERVVWALQGRFEHGKVILNEDEDWKEFQDQLLMFPTTQVHDDLVDALSYVDQLAITSYFEDDDNDGVEPLDFLSGY
jgi:phage terminase large subunit-like protein